MTRTIETERREGTMSLRFLTRTFVAILAVVGMAMLLPAAAANAASPTHLRISSNQGGYPQHLELSQSKSIIVDLPVAAHEVIVSSPQIASAIMRSSTRAIVQGNSIGETNMLFLDKAGRQIAVLDISVVQDGSSLASAIRRLIPGANVEVQSFGNRIVLSGSAQSADDVNKAILIAGQVSGSPDSVVSVINIAGSQQVMLKVTVAEVNRTAARQLGINLSTSFSHNGLTTTLLNSRGNDAGSASATGGAGELGVDFTFGSLSVDATLRALEGRNALRLLAEPTLTALSGQEANFLVGGEIPILVTTADGTTTDFKPYGVELAFTPTVRSNGIIGLQVATSVSEVASSEGALTKRSAQTSVELPTGATLAIAGLIEERTRQEINSMPGLGNVPILGALFRSRDYVRQQTELLVLVTPYLTAPGRPSDFNLPTDNMAMAGDAEAVFLGRLEALYGVGGSGGGAYQGNVGFVLD